MAYRVVIDKDACQSSGNCVDGAPTAFAFDEDDLADVTPAASGLARDRLIAIARSCPAMAIRVFEADGGEVDVRG